MPGGPDLIYRYDGSFDGFLCCVFTSYEKKEIPREIFPPDALQCTLFPAREIPSDPARAARVLAAIPKRMGPAALDFVRRAFLTCLPRKERHLLIFLRIGFRRGPDVMRMLTDDTVSTLFRAVGHLNSESHLLMGFIRFSDFHGALVSEIEPKNMVLPLLSRHFCERYPEERFLIHDKTHHMALVYRPHRADLLPIESLSLPAPDAEEERFRALWRLFYRTIEIPGRHSPKCRMSHMPKRYWGNMTEFGGPQPERPAPARGDRPVLPPGNP